MGKIHRLEIENFKSYKDHQIIGPFHQFQSIVGPNGAGKSNLMDAVSFVLGVQSGKLRSANLKELIFKSEGEAVSSKRKCYVKLVYHTDVKTEIVFQRSITAAGQTEYRIDNRAVGREAYENRLSELGILVKSRNFLVFQGDVESIASKSPKALTKMIEEISGSDELAEEYETLSREKAKAQENTLYNLSKKKGIGAEKKQYKEQKDEAEHYEQLQAQRGELVKEFVLWQLFHTETDLHAHHKQLAEHVKALSEFRESKEKLVENAIKEKKKEQAQLHKECVKVEAKIKKLQDALDAKRPDEVAVRTEIGALEARLKTARSSLAKLDAEYTKQQNALAALKTEQNEVQTALDELVKQIAKTNKIKDVTLEEDQLAEYNRRKQQVYNSTAQQQQELAKLNRVQKAERDQLDALQLRITEIENRKTTVGEQQAGLNERKGNLAEFIKTTEASLGEVRAKLADVSRTTADAKNRLTTATEELDRVEEQLGEASSERRESERDLRMAESLDRLKNLFRGVYGRMIELAQPKQKRYNLAVTVAMGNLMDAIIVDTSKTATDCVQYLREQRVGLATFLPLDSIQVKPVNERLRTLGGTARLVLDVISYEPGIEKAVQYAVGQCVVCDTVDEARRLVFDGAQRIKVVTSNGTLIHKSGLMTGGIGGIEKRAARWDEKATDELRRRREALLLELQELGRTLRASQQEQQLHSQVQGLESRLKYSKIDTQATDGKLQTLAEELAALDAELTKKRLPEKNKLQKSVDARQAEIDAVQAEIAKIEDQIFKDFAKAVGVANIREYEATHLKRIQDLNERRIKLADQLSRLTSQIEYEKKRDLTGPLERLGAQVEQDDKRLGELRKRLNELSKADKTQHTEIDKIRSDLDACKKKVGDVEVEVRALKKTADEFVAREGKIKKLITAEETAIEKQRNRRHAIIERCTVEQIALPTLDGTEDEALAMEMDSESQIDVSGSQAARDTLQREDDFVRRVNFSSIKSKKEAKDKKAEERMSREYTERLEQLQSQLDKLNPNLKAIERYSDVQQRYKSMADEFEQARKGAAELYDRFDAVRTERTRRFMAAFDAIATSIDATYKQITRSAGSSAYLTLENREEPYLEGTTYNAIPPNKRFRDIDQLSGGEKTVAALALLFACHGFRPSPFYVLDEVDAALDPNNVIKVASFIRERAEAGTQFVVISLKDTFFERADALVGIYRDKPADCSRTLTLDLRPYELSRS
eukprot:TRINITY_DN3844_c0_g1_i1.p1 TRINITY_DN3844_c0_g1~~TRINITY_DN3844_c0_g1_i1.p1  ORF type:complete len:1226 (+),score=616.02 TRINITY_DN3844_c0_g1_i1:155-3832(+)